LRICSSMLKHWGCLLSGLRPPPLCTGSQRSINCNRVSRGSKSVLHTHTRTHACTHARTHTHTHTSITHSLTHTDPQLHTHTQSSHSLLYFSPSALAPSFSIALLPGPISLLSADFPCLRAPLPPLCALFSPHLQLF